MGEQSVIEMLRILKFNYDHFDAHLTSSEQNNETHIHTSSHNSKGPSALEKGNRLVTKYAAIQKKVNI